MALLMLWIKLQISTLQTKLIHLVLSLTLQMMTALQKTLRMFLDGYLVRMPVNIPDLWLDLGMKIGTKGIQTVFYMPLQQGVPGGQKEEGHLGPGGENVCPAIFSSSLSDSNCTLVLVSNKLDG